MAKDLSQMQPDEPTPGPAAQAQQYAVPGLDRVTLALTWRQALGRKATESDLLDEPVAHRNQVIYGATDWLKSYTGDFDYLVELQAQMRRPQTRGRVFPSYRQAAGILNCMAAQAKQKAREAKPAPVAPAPRPVAPVLDQPMGRAQADAILAEIDQIDAQDGANVQRLLAVTVARFTDAELERAMTAPLSADDPIIWAVLDAELGARMDAAVAASVQPAPAPAPAPLPEPYRDDPNCPICRRGEPGPSHTGSRNCRSGSLASGGNRAHCACDTCY